MGVLEISTFGAAAAFLAHLCVNGATLAAPGRPSWVAFLASVVLGIGFTALLTVANQPEGYVFTAKVWATVVIVGLMATGGAAGTSVVQASSTAKREKATAGTITAEPDVSSPTPRVGG
jgi:hypothetical protein